jgi:rubrerythrin
MESMEDMTARILMASKTDVLNRRVTVPTVEKPLATQVLNHLSSAVKSIFRDDAPVATMSVRGNGFFTKILLIGAGVVTIIGFVLWFWKRKADEMDRLVLEGQQLLAENRKLWKENQVLNDENQQVRDRIESLERNIWEMMELVLNMKSTKNKDGQEKLERQLTILKQCFEDRLSELRKENKHLRENASKMIEDRVCSICFDNRLNRTIVPCGHSVCNSCETLVKSKNNNSCPFCRVPIEKVIPRY